MVITPTGDAVTMLFTLVPALTCMEIGIWQMGLNNKEVKKCLE
jgi:Sec-independent protein secretion pathway component TatC